VSFVSGELPPKSPATSVASLATCPNAPVTPVPPESAGAGAFGLAAGDAGCWPGIGTATHSASGSVGTVSEIFPLHLGQLGVYLPGFGAVFVVIRNWQYGQRNATDASSEGAGRDANSIVPTSGAVGN